MASIAHRTADSPKNKTADNRQTTSRPAKPYPEFPLTPHPTGRWRKKIKGKLWYFGALTGGWEAALQTYKEQVDDIMAGRTPAPRNKDGLRLLELCNRFLHQKRALVDEGALTLHSWYDYHRTCEKLLAELGENRLVEDLKPGDFETVRRSFGQAGWGPIKIGNEINRTRMVFKYGVEQGLIGKPILFGSFKRNGSECRRSYVNVFSPVPL